MANIFEPTEEMIRDWAKWLAERPEKVREAAKHFFPWKLYRLKTGSGKQRVTIICFEEPADANAKVTCKIAVTGQFNALAFERQVFGIDPDDLEECDLPGPDEPLGSLDMDPKEAFERRKEIN